MCSIPMQSGFSIGKFPNPRSVVRSYSLGNNKEAQQFLSRGGQVIIRMRGLPYDATPKQVVSTFTIFQYLTLLVMMMLFKNSISSAFSFIID